MTEELVSAIENKNVIQFNYEGESRTVEPHCYGITTKGNEAIRAYQTDGYSSSGNLGWKMYDVQKIDDLEILGSTFAEPRLGYNKGDKGMSTIFVEL